MNGTRRILISIYVDGAPERLWGALDRLRAYPLAPRVEIDILLLLDGVDAATRAALAARPAPPQSATAEARGAAACFNRLIATPGFDVYVFLEGGALVGPGWLEHLLAALDADPRHGLAGPSTNRSWNEQNVFPAGAPANVTRAAHLVAGRFGATWRTLEPLHSLGDFCYAVKREVVAAIGAADETYGLGPCWEMDYNVRAARAGFRGVWACAAYVHRSPFSERRRRLEAELFARNKQVYQDRFCALRLRGERADYEAHCRGDACEHFAPASLIQIALPLSGVAPLPAGPPAPPLVCAPPPSAAPLVSCIMPTHRRPEYALQAVGYFLRQDYPNRELLIVDETVDSWRDRLPDDPRLRVIHTPPGLSIGAKRNHACEAARGEFIAQWDDDDWYAPGRLSAQLAPLLSGAADVTALDDTWFFDLERWQFWACTPQLHRRLFVENVHGGTLVYRRRIWQRLVRYPDCSLAEDAQFLQQAMRRGATLGRLPGAGLFWYVRHGRNSWSFQLGQAAEGWLPLAEPALPAEDRAFYAARSPAMSRRAIAPPPPPPAVAPIDAAIDLDPRPLISCIMPTADRPRLVAQAIAYFLRQDYANRELVIIDDGRESVAHLVPADARIRYRRLPARASLGAKRNLACEEAHGEIIVHWDDDDWMADWRLTHQVAALEETGADVCGLARVFYYDPRTRQAWQYVYPPGAKPWLSGNTLCYRRSLWRRNPFPDVDVAEDNRFLWSAAPKRLVALPNNTFYVALIHANNASRKRPSGQVWQRRTPDDIHAIMGADGGFYEGVFGG